MVFQCDRFSMVIIILILMRVDTKEEDLSSHRSKYKKEELHRFVNDSCATPKTESRSLRLRVWRCVRLCLRACRSNEFVECSIPTFLATYRQMYARLFEWYSINMLCILQISVYKCESRARRKRNKANENTDFTRTACRKQRHWFATNARRPFRFCVW